MDEDLSLRLVRPMVVVVVKTGLSHRHHSWVGGQSLDPLKGLLVQVARLVGMEAHRGKHLRKPLCQLHGVNRALQIDAGLDDEADARPAGLGNQLVRIILAVVKMSVRVDKHRSSADRRR